MPRTPQQIEEWKQAQISLLRRILNHEYIDVNHDTGDLMIDYSGHALEVTPQERFIITLLTEGRK